MPRVDYDREMRNMALHGPIIKALATASPRKRNQILKDASPEFVQALASLCRVCHTKGVVFPKRHHRRAARMMSRNSAKTTKKSMVSGKTGTTSRGGGFWSGLAKAAQVAAPLALQLL